MAHRDILAPPAPTPTLNSHTSKDWLLNQPSAQPPLTPVVAVFKKRQQRSRIFPWRWEVFALFVSLICLGLICFVGLWAANTIFPDSPFTEFHGIQWSVNSIVALLSTLQRSTMLYVLGEVIGHLKWAWFDRSSSLIQLERFDNASRGVWGSLRFFFTRRLSVAHIGALVIAVSWAIGPFSQQTIRTTQCLREDLERATIPVARSIPTDDLTQLIPGGDFYELGVVAKITALKGLVNPRGNDTAISVGCRSGECTFEELNGITHSTIGVCSKCIDTSLLVTEITAPVELNPTNATFSSNETTLPSNGPSNYPRYTLPPFQDDSICPIENEFWVLAARNTNVEWARKLFDDEFKALVDGHNASVFVHTMTFTAAPCQTDNGRTVCPHQNISTTALPSTIDLVATTCALYPCMKNFFGEVRGGTFYEKLVSTMPTKITELPHNGMSPIRGMNYIAVKSPCKAGRSIFDISSARNSPNSEPPRQGYTVLPMDGKNISVPDDCIYYAPFQYIRGLEGFLDSSFVGLCMSLENYGKVSCEFSWWLEALYRSQNATVVSITDSINGMADAMTNQIRVGNGFSQGIATRGVVSGKSFMPRVCTAFQWGWLMYPAALWAVTTVLLGVIIAGVGDAGEADMGPGDEWDRLPVWKSSILPVLYYGGVSKAEDVETEYKSVRQLEHVGDRRYEALRPLMELGEMQEDAKKRVVRFGKDTSGWRFL